MEKQKINVFDIERELIIRLQNNGEKVWIDFFTKEGLKTICFSNVEYYNKFLKELNEKQEKQNE